MTSPFRKAERRAVKLRAAIDGPTGAGKTLSALRIARGLVGPGGTVAVIDTEHGTSEKFYADRIEGGFVMAPLTQYQPTDYVKMIEAAEFADCLIIDSLSHAWSEGVLSMVDAKGGRFDAWKHVTPHHNRLVTALLTFPGHLIVTMRSKMAYEVSKDDKTGKTSVEKLGLKPVQREGLEYEFDLVMDMDQAHRLTVSKSRVSELADRSIVEPGEKFGAEIAGLISVGIPVPAVEPASPSPARESAPVDPAVAEGKTRFDGLVERFGQVPAREAAKQAGASSSRDLADADVYGRVVAILEAPTPDPEPESPAVIAEKDRRALLAHANEHGMSKDDVKDMARELFGVESTTLIPASRVDELRAAIIARVEGKAA